MVEKDAVERSATKRDRLVPRRITRQVPDDLLHEDLEKYRLRALEFGAADARIISARDVVVDERVRLKCAFPRCIKYGATANCPPRTPAPEEMRRAIEKYEHAILLKLDVPISDFTSTKARSRPGGEQVPKTEHSEDGENIPKAWIHQGRTGDIVGMIEALAFTEGYYLAVGFGAGSCSTSLCHGLDCRALENRKCRFPLRARPSMEAVAIDVFDLVTKVGWDIYPLIVRGGEVTENHCAISVGIVFIC